MSNELSRNDELLRVADVAKHLRVSIATVYRWHADGYGKHRIKLEGFGIGRGLRFTWAAVQDFIRRQQEAEQRDRPTELASYTPERSRRREEAEAEAVLEAAGVYRTKVRGSA